MRHDNVNRHLATPLIQCTSAFLSDDEITGDERKVTCYSCQDWMQSYRACSPKLQDDPSKDRFMYPETRWSVIEDRSLADLDY